METTSKQKLPDNYISSRIITEREALKNELKPEILASQFKALRKERHLTQEQLAKKVGVKQEQISKFESSKANLKLSSMIKMADALGAKLIFELRVIEDIVEV